MAEMAATVKAHGRSDPFHPHAGRQEQAVCEAQTDAGDKFHRRQIECGPELTRERGAAPARFLCPTGECMIGGWTIEYSGYRPNEARGLKQCRRRARRAART